MVMASTIWQFDRQLSNHHLIKGCDYPAEPFRRIIRYPAEPFLRIIRYPAEPVQGVPPDYLLFGGTIAMSGFRRIICYPAERFLWGVITLSLLSKAK